MVARMSASFIGGLAGLVLAVVEILAVSRALDQSYEMRKSRSAAQGKGPPNDEVVRYMLYSSLIVLPAVGYFVGPVLADVLGGN
jgi:hypothetical protein